MYCELTMVVYFIPFKIKPRANYEQLGAPMIIKKSDVLLLYIMKEKKTIFF